MKAVIADALPWPAAAVITPITGEEATLPAQSLADERLFKAFRSTSGAGGDGVTFALGEEVTACGAALVGLNPDPATAAQVRLRLSSQPTFDAAAVVYDTLAAAVFARDVYPAHAAVDYVEEPTTWDWLFGYDGVGAPGAMQHIAFKSGELTFVVGAPPEGYWEALYLAFAAGGVEIDAPEDPGVEDALRAAGWGYRWSLDWRHLPRRDDAHLRQWRLRAEGRPAFFWPRPEDTAKTQAGGQAPAADADPTSRGGLVRLAEAPKRRGAHSANHLTAFELSSLVVESWEET
jgi:hypothetical protein